MTINRHILFFLFILIPFSIVSQTATLKGRITNERGNPVEFANISIPEHSTGTTTNRFGEFEIRLPANVEMEVSVSFISATPVIKTIKLEPGEVRELNIVLREDITILPDAIISVESDRLFNITRINPEISQTIPTVGGFEDILKSLPGVASASELSSQYNVRGGNFDENLVYVNDIPIYRPMLIRSGQQEGLSFINSDMVSSVIFSAGGFEPRYGDKMSSVLDIRYRKPTTFRGAVSAGMLGGSSHIEGVSKNHLFRHSTGIRYKTNRYLLGTMDTQGDYEPNFTDIQTYMTYDFSERFELSFLGNYSRNAYNFVPQNRETSWGTLNEALKVNMYFRGQEVNKFSTLTGALSGHYKVNNDLNLKFILSSFYTQEEETFDILGQYFLNELDRQLGSDNLGDSISNIGVGSFLNHARNYLNGHVTSFNHIGDYSVNGHKMVWGARYNYEVFDYQMREWNMIDSAGYSLPYNTDTVYMFLVDTAMFNISSNRFNAFFQNSYIIDTDKNSKVGIVGGFRLNYWDFNNQFLISPRFLVSLKPDWEKNYVFRFSTGLYHQPPLFKEMIRRDGSLNYDIKAQSSVHFVLGSDYEFMAWDRPFKLITELYYKYLYNLIPYDVDNVRIQYYGENMAHGYAVGIETKIHGEFVPGTESWMSIGVMQTREDIEGDFYTQKQEDGTLDTIFPGFIPRPTDQRVNFGIYFQDYIPNNPTWQLHLSLLFGTGLPFGPPNTERYMAIARMQPYRRVDIGISKRLISEERPLPENNPFRHFRDIWISLEVFNLLDINNEISHTWVKDIRGWQYAVPNFLTGRRVNLKLTARF